MINTKSTLHSSVCHTLHIVFSCTDRNQQLPSTNESAHYMGIIGGSVPGLVIFTLKIQLPAKSLFLGGKKHKSN